MNNISSAFHSVISSTPISPSFKAATDTVKSSHIKMSIISILVVLGIAIISGCISMIYCYYVQRKNNRMQSKNNFDEMTPPILTLKENHTYAKYQDSENPN